jgi:hypothetical protein
MKKRKIKLPNRQISETFLDFLGKNVIEYQVEKVLEIAFAVWSSIVLDTVKGSAEHISMLRQTIKGDPMSTVLIEQRPMLPSTGQSRKA